MISSWPSRAPFDRGSYILIIQVKRGFKVKVGRLGETYFPEGYYAYMGSGMRGLSARIARHLRKGSKGIRWHIDYLLRSREASIVQVLTFPGNRSHECRLTRRMAALAGAAVISPGFGSSDCRKGCPSHLIHFKGPFGGALPTLRPTCALLRGDPSPRGPFCQVPASPSHTASAG